nr:unnamed protein product [Digitaria exilis]
MAEPNPTRRHNAVRTPQPEGSDSLLYPNSRSSPQLIRNLLAHSCVQVLCLKPGLIHQTSKHDAMPPEVVLAHSRGINRHVVT